MKSPALHAVVRVAYRGETIDVRAPEQVRTEADLIRLVEVGRGDSAYTETFLALLDERHAVYQGVGTPVVTRMRGALLLALGHRALPTAALPFVIEELETAHEPWLTAVAAHVLRKYPEPSPSFAQPSSRRFSTFGIGMMSCVWRTTLDTDRRETTTAMAEVMDDRLAGPPGMACLSSLEDLLAEPRPARRRWRPMQSKRSARTIRHYRRNVAAVRRRHATLRVAPRTSPACACKTTRGPS
jgi:hypothetical protein